MSDKINAFGKEYEKIATELHELKLKVEKFFTDDLFSFVIKFRNEGKEDLEILKEYIKNKKDKPTNTTL